MRFLTFLSVFLALILPVFSTDDGLTSLVSWDPSSLLINNTRVFIFAGEFHYQRLPVPEMWVDVFQKMKAEGYNAVTIYFFWSYHSATKGEFDFETSGKDIQRMLDYAKQAGLYVIARPGPYCNAETNGGGFALYLSDGSGGRLRTNDETYHQAWLPWMNAIGAVLAENQITNGGPVILVQVENELQETTHSATNTLVLYMEQIESALRDIGIVVPFSSNEKGERSESWSTDFENVGGAVNVYGLDSYPGGFSCTNPNTGFSVVRNYYQWFQNFSFTQPEYFPEFEGGFFTSWGGSFYDDCEAELSPEFPDVYYKNNIGQRTRLQSFYMTYGGTNWGYSAAPVVYTSYDYSAPLRETREIRDKMKQIKLLGLFTRVSHDLLNANMEGNGTGFAVNDTTIWSWVLRNPDTGAGFYTVQHDTSSSRTSTTFSVDANTSVGPVTIPNVNLNGRQSKIIVTDYNFGSHTLLYSSAEVLVYGNFDVDVLVLYVDVGQVGEFAFTDSSTLTFQTFGVPTDLTSSFSSDNTTQIFTFTQASGAVAVKFSNGVLVYLLDRLTAYNFHAPPTTLDPNVSPDQHIFVLGPYLIRSASTSDNVVSITGDLQNTTTIEVYPPSPLITSITFNNASIPTTTTPYGSLIGQLTGPEGRVVTLPSLTAWKTADSLPEISPTYDDSTWTVCNKTTTLAPIAPVTLPVLFASDYGYFTGSKIYRIRFDPVSPNLTTPFNLVLTAQNGLSSGFSVFLNGDFLFSFPGNATTDSPPVTIPIDPSVLLPQDNLLTVLTSYTGHDETSTASGVENPRGLLGAAFSPADATFTSFKIRGANITVDPVRGPLNNGGLFGERQGWHLPGFPTDSWPSGSPTTGITQAGVQWYVTTFTLELDADLDVPIGISLSAPAGTVARVQIWVNGYMFGSYVPQIGPQTVFPVPPGILVRGAAGNTLALALWAMDAGGASLEAVDVIAYNVLVSGFELGWSGDWGLVPGFNESLVAGDIAA